MPPPPHHPEKKGNFEINSEAGKPCVYPDKTVPGIGNLKGKDTSRFALGVIGRAGMPECGEVESARQE